MTKSHEKRSLVLPLQKSFMEELIPGDISCVSFSRWFPCLVMLGDLDHPFRHSVLS